MTKWMIGKENNWFTFEMVSVVHQGWTIYCNEKPVGDGVIFNTFSNARDRLSTALVKAIEKGYTILEVHNEAGYRTIDVGELKKAVDINKESKILPFNVPEYTIYGDCQKLASVGGTPKIVENQRIGDVNGFTSEFFRETSPANPTPTLTPIEQTALPVKVAGFLPGPSTHSTQKEPEKLIPESMPMPLPGRLGQTERKGETNVEETQAK